MVLSGKREVPESFFIEPFTGLSHPVTSPNYLGIESVWNNFNYWVNMQDCSEGVGVGVLTLQVCHFVVVQNPYSKGRSLLKTFHPTGRRD